MYGAILGDIIGSPFEFDMGEKIKTFELFTPGCEFTDDTVMTIAIADALMSVSNDASDDEIRSACCAKMKKWGKQYPFCGYGARFLGWVLSDDLEPYNSYGNGSAMRVSSAGWLYDSLERTREVARLTAEPTHNHPEGIKGAEATASAMFLARTGKSKEEIKAYIENEFDYDLDRTLDEIRPDYHHVESCMECVPEAIIAFLEGTDFEDSIRNVVSIGGDTDTLAAITGAIAEAYYGVPEELKVECINRIPEGMQAVLEQMVMLA